ncbi:hypothetical protein CLOM_g5732 [Closterium sp. NIES-68]|nr:hypothetical protein CLOM_g5732 [Closterium sp. NIES-68]GJP73779.1 hypothetical protein CLOP_g4463 [Closterium sp. NIES-67]
MAVASLASGPPSVLLEPPSLAGPSELRVSGVEPTPVLEASENQHYATGLNTSLAILNSAHATLLDSPCGSSLSALSLSLAVTLTQALHDGLCASTKIRTHVSQFLLECLEDIEAELPHIHPPAVDCWEWDLVAGPVPVLATHHLFSASPSCDNGQALKPSRSSSLSKSASRGLRVQWLDEAKGAALTAVREFRRCDHEAVAMGFRTESCSIEDGVCNCSLQ